MSEPINIKALAGKAILALEDKKAEDVRQWQMK